MGLMKRKKLISLLLAAAMTIGSAGAVFAGDTTDTDSTVPAADTSAAKQHIKYINGFEDGTVRPDKTLTHAEAVQMLYNLGMNEAAPTEAFNTSPIINRGDFSQLVLASDSSLKITDILTGYPDGSLGLDRSLTRAEAATMINRALGRSADKSTIDVVNDIRIMPDVTKSHWAYYQLVEAMSDHTATYMADGTELWATHEPGTTGLSEGWKNIGGETFYVDSKGLFAYYTTINGIFLDENGRYTTENAELDALLTAEINKIITDGMTQEQKLRAAYDYMIKNYTYRAAAIQEAGSTGWEADMAVDMLKSGKGNCYSWAATYTYLAKKVGYNAATVAGQAVSPKGSTRDHAWTEIMTDARLDSSALYTCDPEIEGVFAATAGETYDLFMKKYGEAVWQYIKPEVDPAGPDASVEGEPDAALSKILDSVYGNMTNEMPKLARTAVTSENEKFYLGTEGLNFKTGVASEPMMTSVAHSVVLLEMNEGADIQAAMKSIKESADPNKWICVGVSDENVQVANVGNYVILVMDDNASTLINNFKSAVK